MSGGTPRSDAAPAAAKAASPFHPHSDAQVTATVGVNPDPPAQQSESVPDGAFAPGANPYAAVPYGTDTWEA